MRRYLTASAPSRWWLRFGVVLLVVSAAEAQAPELVVEAIRFPTVSGNTEAREAQKKWLEGVAHRLGLTYRDAGKVAEVELAGPAGSPVLGLIVHGDVQEAAAAEWKHPPFAGSIENGEIYGRGSADDKGPMVQALLAMAAFRDTAARHGTPRTHTIRLLVGSDEERGNTDFVEYLASHKAPDLSLVLDSVFPVVVGEKAWNAFEVIAEDPYRMKSGKQPFRITKLDAGIATSIVPSSAVAELAPASAGSKLPDGKLRVEREGSTIRVTAPGRAAHAGMNIENGRNALVLLARELQPYVQRSRAADLLAFAAEAGSDLHGGGLGIAASDPLWGGPDVNVATIKTLDTGALKLTINIRAIPGMTNEKLRDHLAQRLQQFNAKTGSDLLMGEGSFTDTALSFDPQSKIVRRLLAVYKRATGDDAPPAISGGGTYAKRVPNAIAFGMWFPGKPYPGHDTDEHVSIADLQKGARVLLAALQDLACSAPIDQPFHQ
jgi:succinyl-diaminopimelate desuccinylase